MDDKGMAFLRQLISDLEGAPFPNAINNELYTIWYEHVQEAAGSALEYLNSQDPEYLDINGSELGF